MAQNIFVNWQAIFLFHDGFIVIKKICSSWVVPMRNRTTKNNFPILLWLLRFQYACCKFSIFQDLMVRAPWKKKNKVGLSLPEEFYFIWFNQSPRKMMKKDFYFIWTALFILGILVLIFWSCSKSNFVKEIKEIKFVSKFMTPKTG